MIVHQHLWSSFNVFFSQVHSSETLFAHRVLSSCSLGRLRHGPGIESSDMKWDANIRMLKIGSGIASLDVIGNISHGHGISIATWDLVVAIRISKMGSTLRFIGSTGDPEDSTTGSREGWKRLTQMISRGSRTFCEGEKAAKRSNVKWEGLKSKVLL